METESSKSLNIVNTTNEKSIHDYVTDIKDKSTIYSLQISRFVLVKINTNILKEFENLVNLDLSNNIIFYFQPCVFRTLIHLESINLSNNAISEIENGLFETNTKLISIILNHNILDTINTKALLMLGNLEVLDLSYNFIVEIYICCLNCPYLSKLLLNNNTIKSIMTDSFYYATNLIHLDLSSNQIRRIDNRTFRKSTKLQNLNLSNNLMKVLHLKFIHHLSDLRTLNLSNNGIRQILKKELLLNQEKLVHLNLLMNKISAIRENTFSGCQNLDCLKLEVFGMFNYKSIFSLDSLTVFELVLTPCNRLILSYNTWNCFINKAHLKSLKLVFERVDEVKTIRLIDLINLTYLHIECMVPNNKKSTYEFNLPLHLHRMPSLRTLIFKNMNYFTVIGESKKYGKGNNRLLHLDFTGIKNGLIRKLFQRCEDLQLLNLSFSNVKFLSDYSFVGLINLEMLIMEYSKVVVIRTKTFKYTPRLKLINLSNGCIQTIEKYSFTNLNNLEYLYLKNNPLNNVSRNAFCGIQPSIQISV